MRLRPHHCPAALAFMSTSPYDVRPHLVRLFYSGDQHALAPVLTYGVNYLKTWCHAAGVTRSHAAIEYAAADGLMRLYRPRKVMPADERAALLHMRADSFRTLINLAHRVYRRRLIEGAERFIAVATGAHATPRGLSDNDGFRAGEWWDPMQAIAGRLQHRRSAHLDIGKRRSPARRPRSLPGDTGQQLSFDWAA